MQGPGGQSSDSVRINGITQKDRIGILSPRTSVEHCLSLNQELYSYF